MVSPNKVTTEMVVLCNTDTFKNEYIDKCESIVEKQFPVYIDYDMDGDGCHGTDTFIDDDPIKWTFTKYKNGDVVVVGMYSDYLIQAAGKDAGRVAVLYNPTMLETLNKTNIHWVGKKTIEGKYSVDLAFYGCYMESESLNTSLDDEMKAIVDNFFLGVIKQSPMLFDPAW
jgi:hypothetical protein